MEKARRTRKRITVNLDAEIILGGKSYSGVVENLSEFGAKWYKFVRATEEPSEYGIYTGTTPSKTIIDFTPGTPLKLKFKLPSGEKLNLRCEIRWSYQTPHDEFTNSPSIDPPPKYTAAGMEIIDPPPKYKEFFKTLF